VRARAALIGERASVPSRVALVLRRDFTPIEAFPGAFALHLRKP
jgi:hypothetical protein